MYQQQALYGSSKWQIYTCHQAVQSVVGGQSSSFHETLRNDPEPWNKAFSGMLFFCTYARSRWSDAQHSESLIEDRDEFGRLHYLECSTGVHKTARAMQMRLQFLPLVAPVEWTQSTEGDLGLGGTCAFVACLHVALHVSQCQRFACDNCTFCCTGQLFVRALIV